MENKVDIQHKKIVCVCNIWMSLSGIKQRKVSKTATHFYVSGVHMTGSLSPPDAQKAI